MSEQAHILVVDDEKRFLKDISEILERERYRVDSASSAEEALNKTENTFYNLVITDLKMEGIHGAEFAKIVRDRFKETVVIIITGYGSVDSAVELMKLGVYDYIEKPLDFDYLKKTIKEALEQKASELGSQIKNKYKKEYKNYFPQPLLDKIGQINNLQYSNEIKGFKEKVILASEEPRQVVLSTLEALWQKKYKKRHGFQLFETFYKFEDLLFKLPEYREHLFHQFQVFLLGSCIINEPSIHDMTSKALADSLHHKEEEINLDLAWFLTSTFHDLAYPIEKIDDWMGVFFSEFLRIKNVSINVNLSEQMFIERKFFEYFLQLSDLYNFIRKSSLSSPPWECDKKVDIDEDLRRALTGNLIKNKDHGILGALMLLDRISASQAEQKDRGEYQKSVLSSIVYPAALAIALHTNRIWERIEYLEYRKYPLAFLLLYCDILHEWGRSEPDRAIKDSDEPQLAGIDITKDKVLMRLEYKDGKGHQKEIFERKCDHIENLFKKLRSSSPLFEIELQFGNEARKRSTFPEEEGVVKTKKIFPLPPKKLHPEIEDPFDVSISCIEELTPEDWEYLYNTIEDKYKDLIDEGFKDPSITKLILCNRKILKPLKSTEILTNDELRSIVNKEKRLCFVISRPIVIEEIKYVDWSDWSDVGDTDWYPTIPLYIGPKEWNCKKVVEAGVKVKADFDTGNPSILAFKGKILRDLRITPKIIPESKTVIYYVIKNGRLTQVEERYLYDEIEVKIGLKDGLKEDYYTCANFRVDFTRGEKIIPYRPNREAFVGRQLWKKEGKRDKENLSFSIILHPSQRISTIQLPLKEKK